MKYDNPKTCQLSLNLQYQPITPASGGGAAAIGKLKPGGGIENCGGIIPGGPGGKLGGGIKGAVGIIGGTKLEAIFGVAGGNPGTAAVGGIPSFEVYNRLEYIIN